MSIFSTTTLRRRIGGAIQPTTSSSSDNWKPRWKTASRDRDDDDDDDDALVEEKSIPPTFPQIRMLLLHMPATQQYVIPSSETCDLESSALRPHHTANSQCSALFCWLEGWLWQAAKDVDGFLFIYSFIHPDPATDDGDGDDDANITA